MVIKKIYLAGQVTGRNYDEAYKQFETAEIALRKYGFDVVNPLRFVHRNEDWQIAMKTCIGRLVECDACYMLRGYEFSQGAKMELFIAIQLGMAIDFEYNQWLPFNNYKRGCQTEGY